MRFCHYHVPFYFLQVKKEKLSRSVDHRTIAVCTHTRILNKHWGKSVCTTIMVQCMSLVGAYVTFGHPKDSQKAQPYAQSLMPLMSECL